jgi:lipopolysaccharide assembly outer membrane protein LptD (OstA)
VKQPIRSILVVLILAIFYQCSSVRNSSIAEIAIPEILPDTTVKIAQVKIPEPIVTDSITEELNTTVISTDSIEDLSETIELSGDSLQLPSAIVDDSTQLAQDAAVAREDSLALAGKQTLDAPVYYTAQDSMVFTNDNMGFLYGKADIKYGEMAITGEKITMDLDSSIISSTFGVDSLGVEFGFPVFTEGGTEYEMKGVRYNFETRKAFIHNVITQQGEGHIVANEAKKNADNSFYMRNAKYTTCDNHDHPHFYLNLSKAKVRPEKDVVTGPAWLVVADVPLFPVVLPFAFFPFTSTYSSGIIMPR